jgi:hypothetical protein
MAARVRAAAAGAVLALACAATSSPGPGAGGAPALTAERLAAQRLAVLPLAALLLPPGATPVDSLTAALSRRVDGGLVAAVVRTGVAGSAAGPAELSATLAALGPDAVQSASSAADAAGPDGRLSAPAAEELAALAEAVGADLLLVPRSLTLVPTGPLRYEARLSAALVDPGAGLVWRATLRAAPSTPPPGDASNLGAAAMESAADAAVQGLVLRLTRLGDELEEPDGAP